MAESDGQKEREEYRGENPNEAKRVFYGLPASIYDVPNSHFFGRSKDMEDLFEALKDDEVYHCCLYGLPGVGKGRLAIELVHYVRNLKQDWIVLYIDAKEITRNADLEDKIYRSVLQKCNPAAVTAATPLISRDEIQRQFAEAMRFVPSLLLVLDRCDGIFANDTEHQLFVSMLSKMVAAGRRDFTIVTTSCSQYGHCCKEQLKYLVKPLDEEAALEFLKFWCPKELRAPVEELAQTCHGLPRYLEAVGAVLEKYVSLGILTPDELLEDMRTDPIRKLDGYLKKSKPSTSFLELFKNMAEDEKISFWCLSLFPGTFSRANGARILGIDERAFACVLMRLVDYALVTKEANGEYRQHYLMRQFALQEAEKANCLEFLKSRQEYNKLFQSDTNETLH